MKQSKVAAWGLLAIGIPCLVAAVIPLSRGGAVNFAYLMLAGVFLVLGSVIAHRGLHKDSESLRRVLQAPLTRLVPTYV